MRRFYKAVVLTWLFVGTTDLMAAYISQWIKTGHFADKMLFYIAGGVLGLEKSMQGGNGVAFLGLCIHYLIAFLLTLFFFWIFPKLKFLWFDKWVVGMLYGVFANLVVYAVITLFSPLPKTPFVLSGALIAWWVLGVVLGIPIAYNAYRFYGVKSKNVWGTNGG